jgi:hypothetical protein
MSSQPVHDPDNRPERLVSGGQTAPQLGRWSRAVPDPNLEDAAIPHLWDWLPGPLERRVRALRQKRWQFVSCSTPGWVLCCAIADAGFAGNAFVYAVNTGSGAVHRLLSISPGAAGVQVGGSSCEDEHRFARGAQRLRIANHAQGRHFALQGQGRFDG